MNKKILYIALPIIVLVLAFALWKCAQPGAVGTENGTKTYKTTEKTLA